MLVEKEQDGVVHYYKDDIEITKEEYEAEDSRIESEHENSMTVRRFIVSLNGKIREVTE